MSRLVVMVAWPQVGFTTVATHSHGRQIFISSIYQSGGKYTKRPLNTPNVHKKHQMFMKYTKFSTKRSSKIYENWDFWYENITIWQPWL
jgi:hypothetical protein